MRAFLISLLVVGMLAGCDRPEEDRQAVPGDAATPLQQGQGIFGLSYLETTLDNGLKVIIVPTDYPEDRKSVV